MRRRDDPKAGKTPFRTKERVFRVNDKWFFASREGEHGPFYSRVAASRALNRYVDKMVALSKRPAFAYQNERLPGLNFQRKIAQHRLAPENPRDPAELDGGGGLV